ncbi:MAG: RDD family protein [Chloroflexota bacterium]|jgi:uncharacterized RDD family membrane protein YckC|nr:RDD family protein [Anaerolineae bacterium]HMM27827.1 RDD family protein [Aggregatilineaceae bacterium]
MTQASLASRLIALIIDSIILAVVGGLVGLILSDEYFGISAGFIVGVLYNGYFWTQNNGQTPGKSLMGIRVVKTNGQGLSWLDAFIRYVGYYINTFLLFIGWLWAFIDSKNQGFHDKLAGTIVVRA